MLTGCTRWCLAALVLLVVIELSACGNRTLTAADYDQTCSLDGDCETVFVGEACSCKCERAAISKRAMESYWRDKESLPKCQEICDGCMEPSRARCDSGHCIVAR